MSDQQLQRTKDRSAMPAHSASCSGAMAAPREASRSAADTADGSADGSGGGGRVHWRSWGRMSVAAWQTTDGGDQ